ncbi:MAG: hypothetical protein QMD71_06310 [bacterium]|nr:hypothetical protein [bacterium]
MSKLSKVNVTNKYTSVVHRGGKHFPPLETTEVEVSDYQLREIKACVHLQVKMARVKPCDSDGLPNSVETVEPDLTEEEQNPEVEQEKGEFDCPYCEDYQGTSRMGLLAHVRQSHKELYDEFRERG